MLVFRKFLRTYQMNDPYLIILHCGKNCPNTVFFQVRMRENTDQKKFRIWTVFTQF